MANETLVHADIENMWVGILLWLEHLDVVLRDIPVYEGWVDETCAELGQNVDDFVASIQKILDKKVDKREAGYQVAQSRSIDKVSHQLADAYRQVMEL